VSPSARIRLHLALLAVAAAVYLLPVWFMVATSLTPEDQVLAGGWRALVPAEATLANYQSVLADAGFGGFLFNSCLITLATVLLGLLVNSWCGFALARLPWRGRHVVLSLVVALMVLPLEAIAVPLFVMGVHLGWTDSYSIQVVPFVANPFAIVLFATFFRQLPLELDEAARMDGCSAWQIYWRVALPLARPALAAVGILTFLTQWGMYLWPLMVTTGPEVRPLPVQMGIYPAQHPRPWGEIMAFGTLMVLPVLVVFLIFQRAFVRGLTDAAVKG